MDKQKGQRNPKLAGRFHLPIFRHQSKTERTAAYCKSVVVTVKSFLARRYVTGGTRHVEIEVGQQRVVQPHRQHAAEENAQRTLRPPHIAPESMGAGQEQEHRADENQSAQKSGGALDFAAADGTGEFS